MLDIFSGILLACWSIWVESAPYILFGFFIAGLIKAFVPEDAIARHLGKNSAGAVVKASLLGIPLPLCSCGVIPATIGLRKQGASKGASAAFLISTPESGIDSIAITWALLDPVMTVVRPVAAFITATAAGLLINLLPNETPQPAENSQGECNGSCRCDQERNDQKSSLLTRFKSGIGYAFGDFLKDIGGWLLIGIGIAGIISYFVPADFFTQTLKGEFTSLFLMLVVGIPLYICATASTPIAAALVLKGLSPGAALIFLLAGPATNAATLTVIGKFFGKAATTIYLATIAICSLLLGWLVNHLYALSGMDITKWVSIEGEAGTGAFELTFAILLAALVIKNYIPMRKSSSKSCCSDDSCSC